MHTTHHVTEVKCGTTKNGDPMYILNATEGTLFAFPNQFQAPMWQQSGYVPVFAQMEDGQVDRWDTHPIHIEAEKNGRYYDIFNVQPMADGAQPDRYQPPDQALFIPRIWHQLNWLFQQRFIIFDTETTGLDTTTSEIVSFASETVLNIGKAGYTVDNLWIRPDHPEQLLVTNSKGKSAYDIHGIHPDDLTDCPTFPEVYHHLHDALTYTHWVCWNAPYDVALLDSLCLRHNLPLIPRLSVTCAMRLLTPLLGTWDDRRGDFQWVKLEDAAGQYDIDTQDAHNAYADVQMTRGVMEAVYQAIADERLAS